MSHSSWNALAGWGQREPPAIWAIFWSWELLEFWAFALFLFSLHPFPLLSFLTVIPSFGRRLMWRAGFSLGHSPRYKSLLVTRKHSLARECTAFIKQRENDSDRLWPWKRTWPQCAQLLVTSTPALSFSTCFLLVKIIKIKPSVSGGGES